MSFWGKKKESETNQALEVDENLEALRDQIAKVHFRVSSLEEFTKRRELIDRVQKLEEQIHKECKVSPELQSTLHYYETQIQDIKIHLRNFDFLEKQFEEVRSNVLTLTERVEKIKELTDKLEQSIQTKQLPPLTTTSGTGGTGRAYKAGDGFVSPKPSNRGPSAVVPPPSKPQASWIKKPKEDTKENKPQEETTPPLTINSTVVRDT